MRRKIFIFSISLLSPSLRATSVTCATAKTLDNFRCSEATIEFDLSKCREPIKNKTVKATCVGESAVGILKTDNATYTATFNLESSWGDTSWKFHDLSIKENLKKKQAKVEKPSVSSIKAEDPKPKLPETPKVVEKKEEQINQVRPSEPEPDTGEGKLTGNWGGLRNKIAKKGLGLGLTYGAEPSYNFAGGVEKSGTYIGKLMFNLDEDLSKLIDWTGGSLHFSLLGTHGKGPNAYVGDAQATSNLQAPATARLYEAWFQQSVLDDSVSFRIGMYDLNTEYNVTESALVFLNSSFGVGYELSQSPANGSHGPSIYPVPSVGGRVMVNSGKNAYVLLGVFDGVPGDPNNSYSTRVKFDKTDGLFLPAEVGFLWGREENSAIAPGKWSLGAWSYTQAVDTIQPQEASGTVEKAVSHGFYTSLEQTLSKKLSAFVRYGMASKDVNNIASNLAAGIVLNKVLPIWDNDQLGLGVTSVFAGSDYLNNQESNATPSDGAETAFELLYRFELIPGLALQPDFQYVVNPNLDPTLSDAFVGALRIDLNL